MRVRSFALEIPSSLLAVDTPACPRHQILRLRGGEKRREEGQSPNIPSITGTLVTVPLFFWLPSLAASRRTPKRFAILLLDMLGHEVFITGGTGYIGRRLIPALLERGHKVRALVRPESERNLPPGCTPVLGNALDQQTFSSRVQPSDTFVQLIGVPHPKPSKAGEFRTIDLVSVRASVAAAVEAKIRHFIYVSVAHPAPVMKAYIEVRSEGESLICSSGLDATIIRPWYVMGPGHWWPCILLPAYWFFELLPATRESAKRLGLVTIGQMLSALVHAVESPAQGVKVIEVPQIRVPALGAAIFR
jgi:uncharacterized protein YbjT (DUF2867 family)